MIPLDTVFLTGSSGGIGRYIAHRLAGQVRCLVLVGRFPSGQSVAESLPKSDTEIVILDCDLSEPVVCRERVTRWLVDRNLSGRIGLVLAASILDERPGDPSGDLADYARVNAINVLGNLAVVQSALPLMQRAGHGRVLFFAGGGAAYAYPLFPAYALSKAATVRLVENLAAAHPPPTGLSFVCVAPGAVDTPMLAKVTAAGGEVRTRSDVGEPVDFVVEFLSSPSSAVSGRYLHVRDDWAPLFDGTAPPTGDSYMLRRVT